MVIEDAHIIGRRDGCGVVFGLTASGIKVSSGGRELLSGVDSGTTLSLGGSPKVRVRLNGVSV
jgi:hypothetical protein